jgi:ankyrin repeat protein
MTDYAKAGSSDVVDTDHNTPLHKALINADIGHVNYLLDAKASVVRVNKKLQTPLHLAVLHSTDTIVEKILQAGADVCAKDKDGKTALYLATEWGKYNIVEKIIRSKPGPRTDTNINDKDGNCPIHAAVAINHEGLTNLLIHDAGANIHAKNNMGRTPLHVLGEKGGEARILDTLLKGGAEINCKDNDGNTPLHLAVGFCHQQIAVELCKRGASVCEANVNDATCLDDLPFGDQNLRAEIQQKMLASLPKPPEWLPDSCSPHCQICKTSFTAKNRRHHCRNCGRLICGKCSPNKRNITKWEMKSVRVCFMCENIVS